MNQKIITLIARQLRNTLCILRNLHSCFFAADVPLNESVRLVGDSGGSTPSRGLVEVLYNGEWGHVCGARWNMKEAIVVCKQLGFQTAVGSFKVDNSAADTSSIFIYTYGCAGDEGAIHYCRHEGWKNHRCLLRYGIAGVICTGACARVCVDGRMSMGVFVCLTCTCLHVGGQMGMGVFVCVCVCVCVSMCVCVCPCVCVIMGVFVYVHVCVRGQVCVWACMCMCGLAGRCVCVCVCVCVGMCVCRCVCVHVYVCTVNGQVLIL